LLLDVDGLAFDAVVQTRPAHQEARVGEGESIAASAHST